MFKKKKEMKKINQITWPAWLVSVVYPLLTKQKILAASQAIHVATFVYSRWIFDRAVMLVWSRFGRERLLPLWLRFHSFPLPSLGVLCGFCSGAGPSDIYVGFRFCLPDPSTAPSRVRIRIRDKTLSLISHGGG